MCVSIRPKIKHLEKSFHVNGNNERIVGENREANYNI